MARYAQIVNGMVHWIFEADKPPVVAPDIVIKDITAVTPAPQEGWSYDAATDAYTAPDMTGTLADVQDAKIAELEAACQQTIFAGTDITDTKGTEHFGLTLEDQTNLSALAAAVSAGAASVPYHADGQLCRAFAAAEFTTVYSAAKLFVAKNTTLCNHLMVWVRRCTTAADVAAITYASKLPDDLQTNYDTIMASLTGSAS